MEKLSEILPLSTAFLMPLTFETYTSIADFKVVTIFWSVCIQWIGWMTANGSLSTFNLNFKKVVHVIVTTLMEHMFTVTLYWGKQWLKVTSVTTQQSSRLLLPSLHCIICIVRKVMWNYVFFLLTSIY